MKKIFLLSLMFSSVASAQTFFSWKAKALELLMKAPESHYGNRSLCVFESRDVEDGMNVIAMIPKRKAGGQSSVALGTVSNFPQTVVSTDVLEILVDFPKGKDYARMLYTDYETGTSYHYTSGRLNVLGDKPHAIVCVYENKQVLRK